MLAGCRERVSPALAPLVNEIPTEDPAFRVLVFIMAASPKAHIFLRRGTESGKHYVRISRETREARNGILRELLLRRNEIEPWDRRICASATTNDLNLVALRDALQRMNVFDPRRGIDDSLSDSLSVSPFVPPLCRRDTLSGQLRPRNYAMLLFGRQVQAHVQGAYTVVSIYPGQDRSEPHADRHERVGTLIDQARRSIDILGVHSYIAFDKTNSRAPNAVKYPHQALTGAVVNAMAHRDYELYDPARTTVFSDRIEVVSPGALPVGVRLETLRAGRASPTWRNQGLARFLSRLQLAQADGQGIPTIFRSMREEGCPAPVFDADEARVTCTLPAHPRHPLMREYRRIEEAISLGDFELAQSRVQALLGDDAMNARAVQLLVEVAGALKRPGIVRAYPEQLGDTVFALSPGTLVQLGEALIVQDVPPQADLATARRLFAHAATGFVGEYETRKVAHGLHRAGDHRAAVAFLDKQFDGHREWKDNPYLLQTRGAAYIGLAKQCEKTARNDKLPPRSRQHARQDSAHFLERAVQDLERALHTSDPGLLQTVRTNLDFVEHLRKRAVPKRRQPGA